MFFKYILQINKYIKQVTNRGSSICDAYMEKERTQMENPHFLK